MDLNAIDCASTSTALGAIVSCTEVNLNAIKEVKLNDIDYMSMSTAL